VDAVSAIGKAKTDIRDLERSIQSLDSEGFKEKLSKLKTDLAAVKAENDALQRRS
jgi:hypothetical protein